MLDVASCLLQSRCLFECHLLRAQVGVILVVLDGGAAIISVDVVIRAPIPDLSLLSSTIEGQSLLMGGWSLLDDLRRFNRVTIVMTSTLLRFLVLGLILRRNFTSLDYIFELFISKIFGVDGEGLEIWWSSFWFNSCLLTDWLTTLNVIHLESFIIISDRILMTVVMILLTSSGTLLILFWRNSHRWRDKLVVVWTLCYCILTEQSWVVSSASCAPLSLLSDVRVLSLYPIDLIFDCVKALASRQRLHLEWVINMAMMRRFQTTRSLHLLLNMFIHSV